MVACPGLDAAASSWATTTQTPTSAISIPNTTTLRLAVMTCILPAKSVSLAEYSRHRRRDTLPGARDSGTDDPHAARPVTDRPQILDSVADDNLEVAGSVTASAEVKVGGTSVAAQLRKRSSCSPAAGQKYVLADHQI